MRTQGFTLVELLVVLAILGALTALAPFALNKAMPSLEEKAAARDLAKTLTSARSLALSRNQSTAVVIDLAARTFALEGGEPQLFADSLEITLVTAESEVEDETSGRLVFYADGTATGGEVRLQGSRLDSLITVDWLTARVQVAEGGSR